MDGSRNALSDHWFLAAHLAPQDHWTDDQRRWLVDHQASLGTTCSAPSKCRGEKAPWILHKLHLWHERRTKHDKAEEQWRVGGHFPYLGVPVTIAADSASPSMEFSGELYAPAREDRLSLPLSVVQSSERLQGKVYQWLHDRAKAYFAVRLDHFCALAGSEIKSWRLAAPKARWGSCSSDRRIMLNWRLIHFPVNVVDYVVAHEVAHLRHMNHGPQFWQEVARLYPDYKQARGALRSHHPGSMPLF